MNRLSAFAVIAISMVVWISSIPALSRPQRRVHLLSRDYVRTVRAFPNSMGGLRQELPASADRFNVWAIQQSKPALANTDTSGNKTYRGKLPKFGIRRRFAVQRLAMPQQPSRMRRHSAPDQSATFLFLAVGQWAPGITRGYTEGRSKSSGTYWQEQKFRRRGRNSHGSPSQPKTKYCARTISASNAGDKIDLLGNRTSKFLAHRSPQTTGAADAVQRPLNWPD